MKIPTTRVRSAIDVVLGFVREHEPESSTRLVMIVFAFTASAIGIAAAVFAFVRNRQLHEIELLRASLAAAAKPLDPIPPDTGVTTVSALAGIATLFIGSGAVAIALRTRKDGEPGDPSTATPSTPPAAPSSPPPSYVPGVPT